MRPPNDLRIRRPPRRPVREAQCSLPVAEARRWRRDRCVRLLASAVSANSFRSFRPINRASTETLPSTCGELSKKQATGLAYGSVIDDDRRLTAATGTLRQLQCRLCRCVLLCSARERTTAHCRPALMMSRCQFRRSKPSAPTVKRLVRHRHLDNLRASPPPRWSNECQGRSTAQQRWWPAGSSRCSAARRVFELWKAASDVFVVGV